MNNDSLTLKGIISIERPGPEGLPRFMKKLRKCVPPDFSPKEVRFFKRLRDKGSKLSEYRRFFNITVLIGVTWGVVFLSTVI